MTLLITQVAPRIVPQAMLPPTPAPIKTAQWAERTAGHRDALSSNEEKAAGLVGHAVFSAGVGAAYGLARAGLAPVAAAPAPVAGVIFGLAVWAATFQGALPALGVMRRTTQHGLERWPAPLMGHDPRVRSPSQPACAVSTTSVSRPARPPRRGGPATG